MASRSILELVLQDADGDALSGRTITVTKPDGSALGVSMYDAVSGGSPVTSPQTNSVGTKRLYANFADLDAAAVGRVKVSFSGVTGDPVDAAFWPDPKDLFVDGMTTARTLGGTLGVSGLLTASAGISSVLSSASVNALSLQNTASGGKSFQILNDAGTPWVTARKSANGHQVFSVNTINQSVPDNNTILFADTHDTINATGGYVMFDCGLAITVAGQDDGAARFIASQTTTGGNSGFRGLESYGLRSVGANAANGVWGAQVGAHSSILGTTPYSVVGLHVSADNQAWGLSGAPVRANTGIMITGADGWDNGIVYFDRDNATTLFSVSQVGKITSGDHVPRTASTYQSGTGALPWLLVNADFYVVNVTAGVGGSAAAPAIIGKNDGTAGFFHPATSVWAVSGNSVETMRWRADNLVDFSAAASSIALGGGAAPTLGTIGGSGPGTAGQNSWLKIFINGTASYIPVWR